MLKSTEVQCTLLIASDENEGILDKVFKNLGKKPPRIQSGTNWSLRHFIDTDLKSFTAQTYIVLDIAAFSESGDEFIELLPLLQEKHGKAEVIVYCADLLPGDLFLHKLVKSGYTNVIAGYPDLSEKDGFKLIQADLTEAVTVGLSEQKYSRYVISEPLPDTISGDSDSERIEDFHALDFSQGSRRIAVFGSQRRIGMTTFALNLCRFVAANGGRAALVLCCSDAVKESNFMCKYFSAEQNDGCISFGGIDVFAGEPVGGIGGDNPVVYDCGDVKLDSCQERIERYGKSDATDAIFLCCGVGWKELHIVTMAHAKLNGLQYTAVVSADAESCERHEDVLCGGLNGYVAVDFRDCTAVGGLLS